MSLHVSERMIVTRRVPYTRPTVERRSLYAVVQGGGPGSIDGGEQPTGPIDRPTGQGRK